MRFFIFGFTVCLFATTSQADVTACLISAEADIPLGSPTIGVIAGLNVERGDRVTQGQLIAQVSDQVERRSIDLASLESSRAEAIDTAREELAQAQREAARIKQLYGDKLVSRQELDKALTEARIAEYTLQGAEKDASAARLELKLAQAKMELRKLRSPVDGVVTEVYLHQGQRVSREPVARIMKLDPLKVELVLPAERFGRISKGQQFTITPDLQGLPARIATVTIVDPVLDAASNTFRVQLTMPNADYSIPAGARCSVNLDAHAL